MTQLKASYAHQLKSGIEIEFTRMMSTHQEWLSQGKGASKTKTTRSKTNTADKNIDDVLADVLIRIGSINMQYMKHEEKLELVQGLLYVDTKEALSAIRFFSVDIHFPERQEEFKMYEQSLWMWNLRNQYYDEKITDVQVKEQLATLKPKPKKGSENLPELEVDVESLFQQVIEMPEEEPEYASELPDHEFTFTYTWKDKDNHGNMVEKKQPYTIPLHFHDFKFEPPYRTFSELPTEEEKTHFVQFPISKRKIRWSMLDVKLQNHYSGSVTAETININTPIEWRNPCVMEPKTSGGEMPIKLSGKKEMIDIETLRLDIYKKEGKADTTFKVKHPEKEEMVTIDALNVVTFFIPSGVA